MTNLTRSQAYDKLTHYAENNEYARDDLLAIRELLTVPEDLEISEVFTDAEVAIYRLDSELHAQNYELYVYLHDTITGLCDMLERLAAGRTEKLDEQN